MTSFSPRVINRCKIVAALFPGLLITLQNFGFFWIFPENTPLWFIPIVVIIFTGLVLAPNAVRNQKTELWTFPAIGGSLWGFWYLILIWIPRMSDWIFDTVLAVFSIIALVILYRLKWTITKSAWIQFLIVALSISALELFRTSDLLNIQTSIFIQVLLWATYLIPILAIGLLLGRHYDAGIILLVVTLEPFLLERYLGENISYEAWTSTLAAVQISKIIFQLAPYLIFLILLPLITLTLQSLKTKIWVLNIVSIINICVLTTIRVYFLRDPNIAVSFSLVPWAMWLQFVLVLYSPILLSTSISKTYLV